MSTTIHTAQNASGRGHLDAMVRGTVEETLNAMLDAEADELCQAQRYERSADRVDTRAGHYKRKLHTKAGEVELKMPKLRRQTFETAIIERYRRRDISIEEAIVQMYLAGVSVRWVEDVTEALWGTRVSSGTVSKLNQKVYRHIERWRSQQLEGDYAYVSIWMAFCSSAAGVARSRTSACWRCSVWTRTAIAGCWAWLRATRKTRRVGWAFLSI
jgi:transposase-like protein